MPNYSIQYTAQTSRARSSIKGLEDVIRNLDNVVRMSEQQFKRAFGMQQAAGLNSLNEPIKALQMQFGNLGKSAQTLQNRLDGLNQHTRQNRTQFQGLGGVLGAITPRFLTLAGAIALTTTALRQGTQLAREYSTAFGEVRTIVDDATFDLGALQTQIDNVAIALGQSPTVVARAAYQILSAGARDAAAANQLLAQSAVLAQSGVTSIESAAGLLSSTLNSYGLSAEYATDISDILFTTVQNGITRINLLEASLGNVTPIAASLGIAFDDLGAALATVTKTGIPTNQAVTSLRNIFLNIAQPLGAARREFEELGITYGSTAFQGRELSEVLEEILTATEGDVDIISRLFPDRRSRAALLALISNNLDNLNANVRAFAERAGASRQASDEFGESLDTRLNSAFTAIGVTLRDLVNPFLNDLATLLEDILDLAQDRRFNELSAQLESIIPADQRVNRIPSGVAGTEPLIAEALNLQQRRRTVANLLFGPEADIDAPISRTLALQREFDQLTQDIDTLVAAIEYAQTVQDQSNLQVTTGNATNPGSTETDAQRRARELGERNVAIARANQVGALTRSPGGFTYFDDVSRFDLANRINETNEEIRAASEEARGRTLAELRRNIQNREAAVRNQADSLLASPGGFIYEGPSGEVLRVLGNRETARLNALTGARRSPGGIVYEDSARQLERNILDTAEDITAPFDRVTTIIEENWNDALGGVADQIGAIAAGGEADFKSLAQSIFRDLSSAFARAALLNVFGLGSQGGSGGLGQLLFGSITSGITAGLGGIFPDFFGSGGNTAQDTFNRAVGASIPGAQFGGTFRTRGRSGTDQNLGLIRLSPNELLNVVPVSGQTQSLQGGGGGGGSQTVENIIMIGEEQIIPLLESDAAAEIIDRRIERSRRVQ